MDASDTWDGRTRGARRAPTGPASRPELIGSGRLRLCHLRIRVPKIVKKVAKIATAPARIVGGAGVALVKPKLAKQLFGLDKTELALSRITGAGVAAVGVAVVAAPGATAALKAGASKIAPKAGGLLAKVFSGGQPKEGAGPAPASDSLAAFPLMSQVPAPDRPDLEGRGWLDGLAEFVAGLFA